MRRLTLLLALGAVAVLAAMPAPAGATIHEIVASFCSGQHVQDPPGISGGSSADNFAKPLLASGVASIEFDPALGGLLVSWNEDRPNLKFSVTGEVALVGEIDGVPVFLQLVEPDHAAFEHCPNAAFH